MQNIQMQFFHDSMHRIWSKGLIGPVYGIFLQAKHSEVKICTNILLPCTNVPQQYAYARGTHQVDFFQRFGQILGKGVYSHLLPLIWKRLRYCCAVKLKNFYLKRKLLPTFQNVFLINNKCVLMRKTCN